ncbi:hypothetical protein IAS59_002406 [Cryptococcus gattii]
MGGYKLSFYRIVLSRTGPCKITKQNQNQPQRCSAPTVAITGLLALQFRITNGWNMRAFVVSGDFEKLLEGMTGVTHLAMSLNTLVLRFCHIVFHGIYPYPPVSNQGRHH